MASARRQAPVSGMLQQPLNLSKEDKGEDPTSTSLGNPASMLPFLTAQASSVFSIASASQGNLPSAGGILTPSMHVQTCGGRDSKLPDPSLAGLDLWNGWKVVGLTLLAPPPLQTPASVQLPQNVSVSSGLGTQDVDSQIPGKLSEPSTFSNNTPQLLPSSISGEWKVVGLTSLSQRNSGLPCNSGAVSVENLTLPSSVSTCGAVDLSMGDPKAKQIDQHKPSELAGNLGSSLNLPSLADVAAGTSEWKIAGVTTLISPLDASGACKTSKAQTNVSGVAVPAGVAPDISMANTEWKVVGVTSLSSPSLNSAPIVVPSSTPSPLVMASAPPMVPLPLSPSASKDMVWKVVGMVPLQQPAEALPSITSSQAHDKQPCNISGLPVQIQSNNQGLSKEAQTAVSTRSSNEESEKLSVPLRRSVGRKWAPRRLERREDPHHPLGFLKNCSSRFRNEVLKRNTVSTMLELKRAYQDNDKQEKQLDFTKGTNRSVSKNLMLKCLSKSAKRKSLDYDDLEEDSDELDIPISPQNSRKKQNNQKAGGANRYCVNEDKVFHKNPSKSARCVLGDKSSPPSITDDQLALSKAYRAQVKFVMDNNISSPTPPQPHSPCQEREDIAIKVDNHQRFSDVPLKMIKSEVSAIKVDNHQRFLDVPLKITKSEVSAIKADNHQRFSDVPLKMIREVGHLEMNLRCFDSDAVNLSSVDPWGVCTYDSLGDMSEMMTNKRDNSVGQSSSRKRKLTTPRKMIQ